jgi:hypothetical protein
LIREYYPDNLPINENHPKAAAKTKNWRSQLRALPASMKAISKQ